MSTSRLRLGILTWLCLFPLCLAMGFGGGGGPANIPEPQLNYKVQVTDTNGKKVTLTFFSIEGQTYVQGELGAGMAAIPFAKIQSALLTQAGDRVRAVLSLKDGQSVTLLASPKAKAYGRTSYGNYVIPLGEVTGITILGEGD